MAATGRLEKPTLLANGESKIHTKPYQPNDIWLSPSWTVCAGKDAVYCNLPTSDGLMPKAE